MTEIELSHLSQQYLEQRLGERVIVEEEPKAWTESGNEKKVVAKWPFTTANARIKLRQLYPTI